MPNVSNIFLITETEDNENVILNKTYKEIKDAFLAGISCVVSGSTNSLIIQITDIDGEGMVITNVRTYEVFTENDYPSYGGIPI